MKRLLVVAVSAVLLVVGCAEDLGQPGGEVQGFERVVLAELFTATWCGNCPKAEAGLDQVYDEEGPGRIAVIHWHPTELGDPFGLPVVDERWAAYRANLDTLNAAALPTCIFNGVDMLIGAETNPYPEYKNSYDHERELGSPYRLSLERTVEDDDLTVMVGIEANEEAGTRAVEMWVVLAEHRIPRPDIPSAELFSFVARQTCTRTVTIAAGTEQDQQAVFELDDAWDREKLHVIAFLQDGGAGEVLQAAMASLSFRAFTLSAPDTTFTGETPPRSFPAPFTIENTGSLRDSLEIDLPAALLDLPEGWTAELQGVVPHEPPLRIALDPGEVIDSLHVLIASPGTPGKGSMTVAARSLLDEQLEQSLTFEFQFGGFSFEASGPEETIRVQPGAAGFGTLSLRNTGIEDLELTVELPTSQPGLPSGWSAELSTTEGTPLESPATLPVTAGDEIDSIGVRVTTSGAGMGSVTVLVSSPQSIADPTEITIDVQAGEVVFTVAPRDTTVILQLNVQEAIAYRISATGAIASPIFVVASQTGMPLDWTVVVCDSSLCYGPVHTVQVEKIPEGIILEILPVSVGSGTAQVYFSSTIDPTVADTASIHYSVAEPGGEGFDRVVVTELFTSIVCVNCPKAEGALDSLLSEEGASRMALVHWHPTEGALGRPELGTLEANERMTTYFGQVTSLLPQVIFDGGESIVGATTLESAYDNYRTRFDAGVALRSPAEIRISDLTGPSSVTVNASIEAAEGTGLTNLAFTIVLMEYARHGVITGLPGPFPPSAVSGAARVAETVDVASVPAGTAVQVGPIELALDEAWDHEQLYIVAILQDPSTLEVVQGAMVGLNQGAPPKR